jgi:5-methylcytosine-specific restriction endonuclease McrBC regulatory subunit McrC
VNREVEVRLKTYSSHGEPIPRDKFRVATNEGFQRVVSSLAGLVELTPRWDGQVQARAGGMAGEVACAGIHFIVEPAHPVGDLLRLLCWERGFPTLVPEISGTEKSLPVALPQAISAGLVAEAERVLAGDPVRAYLRREDRLLALRGNIRFDRLGVHPPGLGVDCRYQEGSTDVLENRLALAGAARALRWLVALPGRRGDGANWSARAWAVARRFGELASSMVPSRVDFAFARGRDGHRAERYRALLWLAELLIYGGGPVITVGTGGSAGWMIDLPALFEASVTKVVKEWASARGYSARAQARERRAILDGAGSTYREIRPDLEIWREGRLLAIIDAKYKGYARNGSGSPDKVLPEDLYQLAFYRAAHARHAPKVGIVSPVGPSDPPLERRWRRIYVAGHPLDVLGVDLGRVADRGARVAFPLLDEWLEEQ